MQLQVRQLKKVFDSRSVLAIEQLDVNEGEIVAIIGPVESGKTTLLRVLCGETAPSGGTVMLNGQDIHRMPSARTHIGVLFEENMLYERLGVQENLEFFCQLSNIPKSRIVEVLSLVGMSDQAQKRVNKLSASTQRRLAFARMLLHRPTLLLLDSPTLHTDADTQILFLHIITQLAAEGCAILLTEEDLAWAGKCCTRVIELENGRITQARNYKTEQEQETPPAPERLTPFKVPARKEDRILLYDPGDLLYATSRDGKTFLRTATEEASTNLTLQELEHRLVGRGFFKAHRAYLVNLQHIKAVIQYTRNSYTLLLNDDKETMIPLSKQCEKELQELLGY